jgi:hypothetical protein
MNYSIPVYRAVIKLDDKHLSFFKEDVEDIIDQQLMITKLCSSISFKDTNDMDEYERVYVLKKLIQMRKEENEAKEKAIEEAKNRNKR